VHGAALVGSWTRLHASPLCMHGVCRWILAAFMSLAIGTLFLQLNLSLNVSRYCYCCCS
jgi:hypothetical protein